jgi:hypothetical protein
MEEESLRGAPPAAPTNDGSGTAKRKRGRPPKHTAGSAKGGASKRKSSALQPLCHPPTNNNSCTGTMSPSFAHGAGQPCCAALSDVPPGAHHCGGLELLLCCCLAADEAAEAETLVEAVLAARCR